MVETSNKKILLLLILAFAFVNRYLLMTWNIFPPGADIGLHQSIIYSIMPGHTTFVYNYYHMGGGASATNPGYHIFVAFIMLMTGIQDYVAQTLVVCLFSTFIVLATFIITREVWNESAAYIVAFLATISSGDIAMITWAGYPNVITLMLIPAIFFMYLQRHRFSTGSFLAVTSLLIGAVFLTHTFSALMFIAITATAAFFGIIFAKKIGISRTYFIPWLVPIVIGALTVSPYLYELAPLYFGAQGTVTGEVAAINQALLATRLVPVSIVFFSLIPFILVFLISKEYKHKFLTVPTLLFAAWIIVPALLTQSFLIHIYLDYNRFLYFLALPEIVFIGLLIDHGSRWLSIAIDYLMASVRNNPVQIPQVHLYPRLAKLSLRLKQSEKYFDRKNIYAIFVVVFLVFCLLLLPVFTPPSVGIVETGFYQTMSLPEYQGVQWVRQNTPIGSVCVTDALYGWWLSGFAERPTLAAVSPQFLILAREYEPAKMATSLLDTDYVIDNGLFQLREDGAYVSRHNPMFLYKFNDTVDPFPFFHFNSSEITIMVRQGIALEQYDLNQLPPIGMHIQNTSDYATIFITRGNQLFNFTEETTVYSGVAFANMSMTMQSNDGVSLDWARLVMHTKGQAINGTNTTALITTYNGLAGQLVFTKGQPATYPLTTDNPSALELDYNLQGSSKAEIQFYVGIYPFEFPLSYKTADEKATFLSEMIANRTDPTNPVFYLNKIKDFPLDVFDYRSSIKDWNVSYIILRNPDQILRFTDDPMFTLAFINKDVTIVMVKPSFKNSGTLS
jgi:hypothetical protein